MEFEISPAQRCLSVRVSGAPSEADARRMLVEMCRRSVEANVDAALLELRLAYGLDPVAVFGLVRELASIGFPPTYRFALLLLDEAAAESAQFGETAALNRGWQVKLFRQREPALAWLEGRAA